MFGSCFLRVLLLQIAGCSRRETGNLLSNGRPVLLLIEGINFWRKDGSHFPGGFSHEVERGPFQESGSQLIEANRRLTKGW
jgi:hypothetical protein